MGAFMSYSTVWRLGSVSLSALGFLMILSIYGTLGHFNGIEPPELPINLTLHSIAAAQSTISAWCIRTAVIMASGTLCWHYMKSRGATPRHFSLLLDLAGSPFAVIKLIGHSISMRLFLDILLIVTFAVNEASHFATQQAINSKTVPDVRHDALLPRSVDFQDVLPGLVPGLGILPPTLEYATATAMFEPNTRRLHVRHHCPGQRCHWRSSSLEIRAQCSDLNHLVVASGCHDDSCESYVIPGGPSLSKVGTTFNTTSDVKSLTFPEIKQPLFTVQLIAKQSMNGSERVVAFECIQYPVAVILETNVIGGNFSEVVVEEWYNKTARFFEANPDRNDLAFIVLTPGGQFGSQQFIISQVAWVTSQYTYIPDFRVAITESVPTGNRLFATLLKEATLNGNIKELIAKHALAQTTYFREHDHHHSQASGTSTTDKRVFSIHWGWLTIPLVVSVVALFLCITILECSFGSNTFDMGYDSLAVLEAGPREAERPVDFHTSNDIYILDSDLRLTRRGLNLAQTLAARRPLLDILVPAWLKDLF